MQGRTVHTSYKMARRERETPLAAGRACRELTAVGLLGDAILQAPGEGGGLIPRIHWPRLPQAARRLLGGRYGGAVPAC